MLSVTYRVITLLPVPADPVSRIMEGFSDCSHEIYVGSLNIHWQVLPCGS